jgi:hypothetical protein
MNSQKVKRPLPGRLAATVSRFAAFLLVIGLTGCLRSAGPLVSVENAVTPLPPGVYEQIDSSVSRRERVNLGIQGRSYIMHDNAITKRFHVVQLTNTNGLYIVQDDDVDKSGFSLVYVVLLRGPSCFSVLELPHHLPGTIEEELSVDPPVVTDRSALLRWLTENADSLAARLRETLCFAS